MVRRATANRRRPLRDVHRLVLTDRLLGDADGLEVLAAAKAGSADTEVVIITAHGSISSAVDAIKNGAYDYLEKPVVPDEVRAIVRAALASRGLSRTVASEAAGPRAFAGLIGESPAIRRVRDTVEQLAGSDVNVLVTGESGTGKEVVARAIHDTSGRRNRRLLAINCASFSQELLSNELFGLSALAAAGLRGFGAVASAGRRGCGRR